MSLWSGPATRCARPWGNALAALALLLAGACAPRATAPAPAPPPASGVRPDLPRREPLVRVGVIVDTSAVEVGATTGFELVDPSGNQVIRRFGAQDRVRVTTDSEGRLRFLPTGAATATPVTGSLLLARPVGDGTVQIGGKAYRGSALLRATGPGRVTAINQVDMEAYLLGVVPREIGRVGPELLEAAKAQAVAARTYAVRYLGRREALGFDVFATVQDQVYGGVESEHEPVSRAVRETQGEILTYRGEPIEAFYHSTCAGHTAAIDEVWNEAPRPYLKGVVDVNPATGEAYDRSSSRFQWTQRWTAAELTQILNRTLADSLPSGVRSIGEIRDMQVLQRTPSGRIRALRIGTTAGNFTVGGDRIRWIFLTPQGPILNSSKFDVELVRDAQGRVQEVVARGGGWGHGIGMCQVGAMGRARAGQEYKTILKAYYTGAEVVDLY